MRAAGAGVEQPEVVVDLGDRADGRARVLRGRLLVDRDRRRETLDEVDVGLVHLAEELPGVGRQRLDVAPLALGEDGVEREARLAGAGQAGEHDQGVAGKVERHVLEVVLPGSPDDQLVSHGPSWWSSGVVRTSVRHDSGLAQAATPEFDGVMSTVSRDTDYDSDLPHFEETILATTRYLAAIEDLSDDDMRAPSALPGWTRGHVVTHLSRNADALTRVLHAAQAGDRGLDVRQPGAARRRHRGRRRPRAPPSSSRTPPRRGAGCSRPRTRSTTPTWTPRSPAGRARSRSRCGTSGRCAAPRWRCTTPTCCSATRRTTGPRTSAAT